MWKQHGNDMRSEMDIVEEEEELVVPIPSNARNNCLKISKWLIFAVLLRIFEI